MSEWLEKYKGWERISCSRCSGHGVVDRSYHDPDECDDCGGAGMIWRHLDSHAYAQYPGGPFLGREPKPRVAA